MNLISQLVSIAPTRKSPEFVRELFLMIGHYSDRFLQNRTEDYLLKLSKARYRVKKEISKAVAIPGGKYIYTKLFAVKFKDENSSRKALGVLISFILNPKREKFGQEHLLTILKKILAGIHVLDESVCLFLDQKTNQLTYYFEIEKIRGKHLTFTECIKLKKELVREIKDGIEFSSPDLWSPENEEQIFKDILRLDAEVNSIKDLPHVIISLKEQQPESIRFNVILLRVAKIDDLSFKERLANLGMRFQLHLENTKPFFKKYIKQTFVFSLEVSNILFYRKNYAVDVLKARQYICMILKQNLGEFRDYNGGLLSKQTEQFNALAEGLSNKVSDLSDFESLFYSLTPTNIQLLFSMETVLELSKLFYELKNEKSHQAFHIKYKNKKNFFFILIRTESDLYDQIFSDLPSGSLIAKVSKVIDQKKYHCLVQINPIECSLRDHIYSRLEKIEKKSKQTSNREINIAFSYFPPSIHPHLTTDIRSLTLCKALYEGLTRINLENKYELALAEIVEISSCKKIYHFKLKSSNWSNGKEITSQDFVLAWKKAISPHSSCIRIQHFFIIKNARKAHEGRISLDNVGIYTPSKKDLIIELEHPADYFLQLIADPIFSPIYNVNREEPSIFNGPFTMQKVSTHKMELAKNECYWDKSAVHLEKINTFLIDDSDEAYQLFKQGKLDWVGSPFRSLPAHTSRESVEISKTGFPFWLFCNTKNRKLSSAKVRRALSYAMNREQIVKQVLSFQKPLYGVVPDEFSVLDARKLFPKDAIQQAPLLFEEGLKEVGLNKDTFEIKLAHSKSLEQCVLAKSLKESWESILQIKVRLIETPWEACWNSIFNRDHEIAGFFFYAPHREFIYNIDFLGSYQSSYTGWDHPDYQKYLILARQSKDEDERVLCLKKAETILNHESPMIPVYTYTPLYLKNRFLHKFLVSVSGYVDFKWGEISE